MAFTYLFTDLQTAINEGVQGKNTLYLNETALYNRIVREVISMVDLRSMKRMVGMAPGIYSDIASYQKPADVKGEAIIDLARQQKRSEEFYLTSREEFDVNKFQVGGMICLDDHDGLGFLDISTALNTTSIIINDFESLTSNGTITVTGDASNASINLQNFLHGAGALQFDTAQSNTAANVIVTGMTAVDLTNYVGREIFIRVFIPASTALTGLTNFQMIIGSDASNYYTLTAVTTTWEGLAFYQGWNTLKFAVSKASATGSPDITKINYIKFVITKTNSMVAQTAWLLDWCEGAIGDFHNLYYYSKYAWQTTSTNAYKENSTATTDILVADTDEFDLFVSWGDYRAAIVTKDSKPNIDRRFDDFMKRAMPNYQMKYPSERMLRQNTYHRVPSLEGDFDINVRNTQNGKWEDEQGFIFN